MIFVALVLAYLSAFLGGYIQIKGVRLSRENLLLSNGFSAGILISIAIAHILPEADVKQNYLYVLLGLGIFYSIQGIIRSNACGDDSCEIHESSGMLAWTGISFHAFVDGIAMGVSFKVSHALGILVMIAILIHKAPMGFTLSSILLTRGFNIERVKRLLMLFAAVTPIGALLSYLLLNVMNDEFIRIALAFSGGTFLHIYASELLPDLHAQRDRRVMYYVLLGIALGVIPKFLLPDI